MNSVNKINTELCKAMGIDPSTAKAVTLELTPGGAPEVQVTLMVNAKPLIEELRRYTLVMNGQGDELDDDHPLACLNDQIIGLMEGIGASEDHEDVIAFLLGTGLPRSTVDRIHRAIVHAEVQRMEAGG